MATTENGRRMRATLVRFGPELFQELQIEARRNGVSVAQYVREAVVARIAYTAGRRGEPGYLPDLDDRRAALNTAARARDEAARVRDETRAVRAQHAQTVANSRRLNERAAAAKATTR
jgi:hypothetical protein